MLFGGIYVMGITGKCYAHVLVVGCPRSTGQDAVGKRLESAGIPYVFRSLFYYQKASLI